MDSKKKKKGSIPHIPLLNPVNGRSGQERVMSQISAPMNVERFLLIRYVRVRYLHIRLLIDKGQNLRDMLIFFFLER